MLLHGFPALRICRFHIAEALSYRRILLGGDVREGEAAAVQRRSDVAPAAYATRLSRCDRSRSGER